MRMKYDFSLSIYFSRTKISRFQINNQIFSQLQFLGLISLKCFFSFQVKLEP